MSGTLRAIEACREAGLPEPEFEDEGGVFLARIRIVRRFTDEEFVALGMNDRQIRAIRYVEEHGGIANATYCSINEVSARTATKELGQIVEAGVFGAVGEGHARTYVLARRTRLRDLRG